MNKDSIAFVTTPKELADVMVKLITKDRKAKILDTGSGKGVFVDRLLNASFKCVYGIELNDTFFEFCKERYPQATFYKSDFLSWKNPHTYDVIIGNPPYMHFNSLPKFIQRRVSEITQTEEADIYYAFIIRSINLLRDGGELIYIVPYHFFYNTYATLVRKTILSKGCLDIVIDLDELRLFKDNHPETVIFKFIKTRKKIPMNILKVKNRNIKIDEIANVLNAMENKVGNEFFSYRERNQFNINNETWSVYPKVEIPRYKFLENIAYVGVGFVSGYKEGFILTYDELTEINTEEKKFVYDFVGAKSCNSFWVGEYSKLMVLNSIHNEKELMNKCPALYDKLLPHKEDMSSRYLPRGVRWFDWMALRNKSLLDANARKPKIFVPSMDRHKKNKFSLTYDFVYAEGSANFIVPRSVDPFFLLGYLNSDFFRRYYLSLGARRGGRISFAQSVLSKCKIPTFTKEIVSHISSIAKYIYYHKDTSRRTAIDEIIADAFEKKLFRKVGIDRFLN